MTGIILLLGNRNTAKGELLPPALARLAKTLQVWRRHPGYKILPTGAFGPNFNTSFTPHWVYLKNYLINQGVPPEVILEGVPSHSTISDALMSSKIINQLNPQDIIIVTSGSHFLRAWLIFRKVYQRPFHFVLAKDTSWLGYFRELKKIIKLFLLSKT